ncbi:ABC transporter permease [Gracilimonas mengyeensis]|uniref:Iron(III) transport system permease protein n=1 Tax=Gracilimonas mengyeensis TaxID=1302730 RepID=A0A521AU54_9BACT|nr:iron ABC transporter permease [Gracilimonas mengyeensis]SMO38334.1 iron(III) transport system permease protein [Gracilimonas mengyeensis]
MLKALHTTIQNLRSDNNGIRQKSPRWTFFSLGIAVLISIPIFTVIFAIFTPSGEIWSHLAETVLDDYIINSLLLISGVSVGVIAIGVSSAWLITMTEFPGRRMFEWASILPFAIPAYLMAYIYTDFLDIAGPLQTTIRNVFGLGIDGYWFPNIRSVEGAIIIMSLSFYPYVYMLARSSFLEQSTSLLEASRIMGYSTWQSFLKVALPVARPGIAAGLALALMETLNDFGTVQYFGVQTFTTGIYRTWFGLGERPAAAQLAAFLLAFIVVLLILERWSRSRISNEKANSTRFKRLNRFKLKGFRSGLAFVTCFIPVLFGFILPVILLLNMFFTNLDTLDFQFIELSLNSFTVSAVTGLLAVGIALVMAYSARLNPSSYVKFFNRVSSLGYAIPGSVIAVGVLIPFGFFDNTLDAFFREHLGFSSGLLLSGTIFAMVFAYLVRFLSVSYGGVEASMEKITPNMDEAARGLGYSFSKVLRKIHIPMMSGGLLTAGLLVFVDVMKELPATLIVRPFNFDTLAVQVYRYASDERLAESAGAALMIVLVGIIPVIIISRTIAKSRKSETK